MARTQTLVQLNDRLVADLDAEAARRGCSRSHIIREAVERYLANESERVRRMYEEAYARVPETEEERRWSVTSTREALEDLPW